jgi:hypothetical protein
MIILPSTPPDLAKAKINRWQRTKELRFMDALASLMSKHEAKGLDKRRISRVISITAKALEKLGGA